VQVAACPKNLNQVYGRSSHIPTEWSAIQERGVDQTEQTPELPSAGSLKVRECEHDMRKGAFKSFDTDEAI
jgi:hypothetical protein